VIPTCMLCIFTYVFCYCRSMQKQLAFMLGRQQVFLELNENMVEYDDLVEIMTNAHLNNHFLNLAREVSCIVFSC
jgi:26S proteasome regulatory subunit N1